MLNHSYFIKLKNLATNYLNPMPVKIIESKIDTTKINELLVMQYSERVLDTLKQELHTAYETHKNYESTLIPHSKEHHRIIDILQRINKDLEILEFERSLIKKRSDSNLNDIRVNLGITKYTLKKITK